MFHTYYVNRGKSAGPGTSPDQVTGLEFWYKTQNLSAGAVGTWADSSTNGRNVTQATATNQPTVQTNVQNGKPGMYFDGVNDFLSRTQVDLINSGVPFSLYAVYKLDGGRSGIDYDEIIRVGIIGSDRSYAFGFSFNDTNFNDLWFGNTNVGGAAAGRKAALSGLDSNTHIVSIHYNGGTVTDNASYAVYLDGSSKTITASGAVSSSDEYAIGGSSRPFKGYLFEIAFYAQNHMTGTTREQLTNYFKNQWGLP